MKRFLFIILMIGLFAVQADAGPYYFELTKDFALQLTEYALDPTVTNEEDVIGSLDVFEDPSVEYGEMSGQVGFVGGQIYDYGPLDGEGELTAGDGSVTAMVFGDITGLGLTGGSDGITSYFQNDNDNNYTIQLFYVVGSIASDGTISGTEAHSEWVELGGYGDSAYLTVDTEDLDLSTIDYIGFRVLALIGAGTGYPTQGDVWHISMTPVPAAVILGILGLGVAGIKLRKYA